MTEEKEYSYEEIASFLLAKMREYGMEPVDKDKNLILDGKGHRYQIVGHKKKDDGFYVMHCDGIPSGYIQDWTNPNSGINISLKGDGPGRTERLMINYDEWRKKREHEEAKRRDEQQQAAARAQVYYFNAYDGVIRHEYLQKKQIQPRGIKLDQERNLLLVPMKDINGAFINVQTIATTGEKRFQYGAAKKGAFFSLGLDKFKDDGNSPILVGEGYATMIKVYELTGACVVAAMDCGNLDSVCEALHAKFPNTKIIIMADNDIKTKIKNGNNPGIDAATKVVQSKKAVGLVAPPFNQENPEGSDWDDYAITFGIPAARNAMLSGAHGIKQFFMTPEQRQEYLHTLKLGGLLGKLDPSIQIAPQEFIGGLFPRGYVSSIVAPSGGGKTIFMQKAVSDLSVGGTFFDGLAENEPVRKCLIFASEAGRDLLLRRAAAFKWAVNPDNAIIADQYTFECADESLMLDDEQGLANIKKLIAMTDPDIIFFDTLQGFHEKDENKATEMKPIIKEVARLARQRNIALVLNHHSRKRATKERTLLLNQDDVIGSSIFNRLVGLIIGIEPVTGEDGNLQVRPLKSWFRTFKPFNYSIGEDLYGHSVLETNLAPDDKDGSNSRVEVWNYIQDSFAPGQWFNAAQIMPELFEKPISMRHIQRILNELADSNKLARKGERKSAKYSLPERENDDFDA